MERHGERACILWMRRNHLLISLRRVRTSDESRAMCLHCNCLAWMRNGGFNFIALYRTRQKGHCACALHRPHSMRDQHQPMPTICIMCLCLRFFRGNLCSRPWDEPSTKSSHPCRFHCLAKLRCKLFMAIVRFHSDSCSNENPFFFSGLSPTPRTKKCPFFVWYWKHYYLCYRRVIQNDLSQYLNNRRLKRTLLVVWRRETGIEQMTKIHTHTPPHSYSIRRATAFDGTAAPIFVVGWVVSSFPIRFRSTIVFHLSIRSYLWLDHDAHAIENIFDLKALQFSEPADRTRYFHENRKQFAYLFSSAWPDKCGFENYFKVFALRVFVGWSTSSKHRWIQQRATEVFRFPAWYFACSNFSHGTFQLWPISGFPNSIECGEWTFYFIFVQMLFFRGAKENCSPP